MDDDRPLDVLLVAPALEMAAPAFYTLNLASALIAAGYRVELVASPGGPLDATFRARGIPLEHLPALAWPPLLRDLVLRRFARRYRERPPRVVHAQSSRCVEDAAAIARALHRPAIASVHRFLRPGWGVTPSWTGVRAILVVSDVLREDVVNRRRAPRERVKVIPAGIYADYEPRPPFDHGGDPVIGTIGELDKSDALEAFVRAASEVLAQVPNAQFLIVGESAERERVRRLIREVKVQRNVTFTPAMDQRKAFPVMDICVLPSVEEGPGHTILEAMAAARPVIAIGAGGAFAAVRDGETGLLVEKEDPRSLSSAVVRLIEDRELARQIGARGRRMVMDTYPQGRMLADTVAVYNSVE